MTKEKLNKAKDLQKQIDELEIKVKNIESIFSIEDKDLDYLKIRHDKSSTSIYIPQELRKVFKTLVLEDTIEKLNKLKEKFEEL